MSQSGSSPHESRHAVDDAHRRCPGHAAGVRVQVPDPSQVPAAVRVTPVHDGEPQVVDDDAKTHAPDALQSTGPHSPPDAQLAEQQWPVPLTPQTPVVHCVGAVHTAPGESFGTHVPEPRAQ